MEIVDTEKQSYSTPVTQDAVTLTDLQHTDSSARIREQIEMAYNREEVCGRDS